MGLPFASFVVLVILNNVVDHRAEKSNVGARSDLDKVVGDFGSAGKAHVDVHNLQAVFLSLHEIFQAHRVTLGNVGAFDPCELSIFQVVPRIGHCAETAEIFRELIAFLVVDLRAARSIASSQEISCHSVAPGARYIGLVAR